MAENLGYRQRNEISRVPHIVLTTIADREMEYCRSFLQEKNPRASRRAAQTIEKHLALLMTTPEMGRSVDDLPGLRELVIPFGGSGYIALYRHDIESDTVYILAFRHQKEGGFE